MWVNLAIGAVLLAVGVALYLTGGFGAGDGKLIAVAGIWIGPADLSLFLLGLAACAFALSLFALLPFDRTRRMRRGLPFVVAIAPPARRGSTHARSMQRETDPVPRLVVSSCAVETPANRGPAPTGKIGTPPRCNWAPRPND